MWFFLILLLLLSMLSIAGAQEKQEGGFDFYGPNKKHRRFKHPRCGEANGEWRCRW
jgi:hypothetical protein